MDDQGAASAASYAERIAVLMYSDRIAPRGAYLTFQQLRSANIARLAVFPGHTGSDWTANDWAVAVTGELGELCNLLKKRRRGLETALGKNMPTDQEIADELADTLTYLDLLAHCLGVDLAQATINKFNVVSERWQLPQRL